MKRTPLARTLLGQRMLFAFVLLFTYGGGWWLWLLHEIEGASEPGAPPGLLHWLRDSSLALPLVGIGVMLGAALARRLVRRYGRGASEPVVGVLIAVVLTVYASVVLAVGNPIHGWLFQSTHGGHDLPLGYHILRDGMLAVCGDYVVAVSFVLAVLAYRWLTSARSSRLAQAAAS